MKLPRDFAKEMRGLGKDLWKDTDADAYLARERESWELEVNVMEKNERYTYWLDIAEYDIETARAMLKTGRYLYVGFMCQQSIEKAAKGLFLLLKEEEPPLIHNIWRILQLALDGSEEEEIYEELEEKKEFFVKIRSYYIIGRYPSYKDKLSTSIDKESAEEILKESEEVLEWVKSLQKLKQ